MMLFVVFSSIRRNKSINVTTPRKQIGITGGQRYRKLKER